MPLDDESGRKARLAAPATEAPRAAGPARQETSVGQPVLMTAGQLSGQTIRAELIEMQKADVGRKFANKDRRPLDPPPIVQLRLFTITDASTQQNEEELPDYALVHPQGFMCHASLFTFDPESTMALSTSAAPPPAPTQDSTDQLFGSTVVQAVHLPYQGKTIIIFVFPDVSVRRDGFFVMRYRCFDILSRAYGAAAHPILAECFGDAFRVYTTRSFPGLAPSTELTQLVDGQGVPTTSRKKKRTREVKNAKALLSDDEDEGEGY